VLQGGVHVRSPFAEYRWEPPGRRKAGQPLRLSGFEDARVLVHSIHVGEPTDLAPLLSLHEPNYSEGPDVDELHDRLAHLLTRGLLQVVRTTLDPTCSEMPEVPEVVLEHAPFENEIDDGVSVVAEGRPEPALTVEVVCEVVPPPILEVSGNVIPPARPTA
jgi:hypothetical protein